MLSREDKEYAKSIVRDCQIKRFTLQETLDYIHSKGVDISIVTVKRMKAAIKKDASNWIEHLAKDRDAYVALYKERIDELRLIEYEAWRMFYSNETRPMVKAQYLEIIRKTSIDITQLHDSAPVVMAVKDRIEGLSPTIEVETEVDDSTHEGNSELQTR